MTTCDNLSAEAFNELFPFHVVIGADLRIRSLGSSWQKVLPQLVVGAAFNDHFILERPEVRIDSLADLLALRLAVVLIRPRRARFALRGQVVTYGSSAALAASPWITAPEKLPELGINLRDFAYHDPTPDLMFMLQGNALSLRDAQEIRRELQTRSEQLQKTTNEAKAANQAKSCFLANVSHELRTPMTAILGYADMLYDDVVQDRHREYLTIIREQGQRLLSIMDDVLDLSKLESGRYNVVRQDTQLFDLLREVEEHFRHAARMKNLSLRVQCHASVPANIYTHRLTLLQILKNLVTNAIKFTEQGGVTIQAACEQSTLGETLIVRVTDSGIGIDLQERRDLFHAFAQPDNPSSRRYGGAGLGLAISRRLAQALGGEISVDSQLGQGSTFTVSIDCTSPNPLGPAVPADLKPLPVADETASANFPQLHYRILVAEDVDVSRVLIRRLLELVGAEPDFATTGRDAVDRVIAANSQGTPYDIVLMDMEMPEMDGYQATRLLRSAGFDLPIVAVTVSAQDDDRLACLEAGCDEFVPKPIDRRLLFQTIVDLVTRHRNGHSAAQLSAE